MNVTSAASSQVKKIWGSVAVEKRRNFCGRRLGRGGGEGGSVPRAVVLVGARRSGTGLLRGTAGQGSASTVLASGRGPGGMAPWLQSYASLRSV
jgi:hypothetical protein